MSSNSSSSDGYDDDDDNDCLSFYDDFDLAETSNVHPLYERDIQLFKQLFPSESIVTRILNNLEEVDIEITADLGFIKKNTLDAWGLRQDLPLTFKLVFNSVSYSFDKNTSKLAVYQESVQKQNMVLAQLNRISEAFTVKYFTQRKQEQEQREKTTDECDKEEEEVTGYLVQLYNRIQDRLQTLNDYCPICDKPHGGTSMLKPTVCSHPLCIFSYQTMGVMCQVTEAIQSQPEVVRLLIDFTLAACGSSRYKDILQPFPDLLDPKNQKFIFAKDANGMRLFRRVMDLVYSFRFKMGCATSESELRDQMNEENKLCYPVLRWIVSSNRSHILELPKEQQIPQMRTSLQFVLRNSPPAEDERFRSLAKKYGSCFAFHGSPLENWHSIVRQGLVVASGTELQLHGAALGSGVYVTTNLTAALKYAGIPQRELQLKSLVAHGGGIPGHGFKLEDVSIASVKNHLCVAMCEVITGPKLQRTDGDRRVVLDSQHICIRFFFMYNNRSQHPTVVDCNCPDFEQMVRGILADI